MFLTLAVGIIFYVIEGIIVGNLTYRLWRTVYKHKGYCIYNAFVCGLFWWLAYPINYPLYKKVFK